MAELNLNFDALWEGVTAALNNVVKTRISIPKGRSYFSIASETHKGLITYQTEYRVRDGKAQVAIETFGGEEAKAAIEAIIAKAPEGHIIKTVEVKQGAKNKDKWAWPIQAPVADFNVYNGELVAWYVNTITALYTFFENESSVASQANVAQPSRKNCVRVVVDIEITEHEYVAFDCGDEMVGGESFVFNSDDNPGFIRITVDGKEIEFDEEELRSEFSDYEPFDMEEKWNSEDIVKFGYYDNIAGKTWEFDVEDFDINKLSFYYECFDAIFGPADHNWEEHRITLRYDGKEIEEDYNAYSCDNGEFEQVWYLYDDED